MIEADFFTTIDISNKFWRKERDKVTKEEAELIFQAALDYRKTLMSLGYGYDEQFADDSGPYPDSAEKLKGVSMTCHEITLARLVIDKDGQGYNGVIELFLRMAEEKKRY